MDSLYVFPVSALEGTDSRDNTGNAPLAFELERRMPDAEVMLQFVGDLIDEGVGIRALPDHMGGQCRPRG